jgi:hypothetical protein
METDPKPNAWIGIDPGSTGAYAILRENSNFDIEDWEDELVPPQTWQRAILHTADGPDTKSRSLVSARRHFPDISLKKSQHGRSDAILMALFAKRRFP